jgi:hypothetical protein
MMLTAGEQHSASEMQRPLARLQLIAVALIGAVVMFAGYAWLYSPAGTGPTGSAHILRYAWIAVAVSEMPFLFILRGAMIGRAAAMHRSQPAITDAARLRASTFSVFHTWIIIALAIFESIAIFGGTILLLSGAQLDILLVAIPFVGLLAMFPTGGRWQSFDRASRERADQPR